MTIKVGINGFGRIGRNFYRAIVASGADIEIVGVNDLTDNHTLAHLLKYDTVLGRFPLSVDYDDENIIVDGKKIRALAERNPADLPWAELGADITAIFARSAAASFAWLPMRTATPFMVRPTTVLSATSTAFSRALLTTPARPATLPPCSKYSIAA